MKGNATIKTGLEVINKLKKGDLKPDDIFVDLNMQKRAMGASALLPNHRK
ncbi:hypothetical protein [Chryseolinea sp. H1M3-3]|nr:hypothetical protein [Chryseolinea sp. H1M3-3]